MSMTLCSDHPLRKSVSEFMQVMENEFEMGMVGVLNYFLGLQIKQMKNGIFNSQSNSNNLVKKFGLESAKIFKTPMNTTLKLRKDDKEKSIDKNVSQRDRQIVVSYWLVILTLLLV